MITLAAMDQLKRVIYVGSFSKTIGAGLRVGFVAADESMIEGLLYQKLVSGMSTSTVTERLVNSILSEGHLRNRSWRRTKESPRSSQGGRQIW